MDVNFRNRPDDSVIYYNSVSVPRVIMFAEGRSLFSNSCSLKTPYSSKIDSIIHERFRKLIYSINTIIECGT